MEAFEGQYFGQPVSSPCRQRRTGLRQLGGESLSSWTALQQWSFTETSQFNLQAKRFPNQRGGSDESRWLDDASRLEHFRPTSPPTARNLLLWDMELSASLLRVSRLSRFGLWTCNFRAPANRVNANLKIDLPAGSANATLQYEPASQAYEAELHAPGIKLDQLETVKARNLQLQGVLDVNASGRGTLQDPKCKP